MKKLFTAVLIANFLIEAPVGIMLILSPESVLPGGQIEGALWARNYGVAVLAISTLVFWIWPNRDDLLAVGITLGFLMFFNWTLLAAMLTAGDQMFGTIVHSSLAVLCTALYFQKTKWCNGPNAERGSA